MTSSESALFQLMGELWPRISPKVPPESEADLFSVSAVDSSHPAFRKISALVKETKEPTTDALQRLVQGKL